MDAGDPAHGARRNDVLNRRAWLLWGVTAIVLFALTLTVALLYIPFSRMAGELGLELLHNAYYALVGLNGLMVIFLLFSALRHRELNEMRRRLREEELETQDARTRLAELSAMFQLSTMLNLQLNLEVILEIIVRRVVSTLKGQQASIMIYNPETGLLETRASYGLESEFARHARAKLGEGIAGWVAQRGEALLLQNRPEGQHAQHFKRDRNITSALSLPLRVGERCVGVLNVNRINHPSPFHERHRDMLGLFAEHVGAVIERAEAMDRLGKRSRELEADNRRLAETNRLKDLFLATASHELKTPLTSVIAYAELLDENANRLDRAQKSEFLSRLRGEAERLLSLIEDILDLARIESGKVVLKRASVSLENVIRNAIETSRGLAAKRGVEVRAQFESGIPEHEVDEVKLRQAVVNLIANAVKFSPEGGTVAARLVREPRWTMIEICDRGPGVRPEDARSIFELFGQGVEGVTAADEGLGIGLHLVKRITELHGGHVGVNSMPGEGSQFWIRIPAAGVAPVSEEPQAAAA
jgi:signal transduction histidine kinase